jgi:hypothetical protein
VSSAVIQIPEKKTFAYMIRMGRVKSQHTPQERPLASAVLNRKHRLQGYPIPDGDSIWGIVNHYPIREQDYQMRSKVNAIIV